MGGKGVDTEYLGQQLVRAAAIKQMVHSHHY